MAAARARPVQQDSAGALYLVGSPLDPLAFVRAMDASPGPDGTKRWHWLSVPPHVATARGGGLDVWVSGARLCAIRRNVAAEPEARSMEPIAAMPANVAPQARVHLTARSPQGDVQAGRATTTSPTPTKTSALVTTAAGMKDVFELADANSRWLINPRAREVGRCGGQR
jgi:hypothetical protein